MFLATSSPMINSGITNDQHIHGFLPVCYLMSLESLLAQDIERHATDTRMSALKNLNSQLTLEYHLLLLIM